MVEAQKVTLATTICQRTKINSASLLQQKRLFKTQLKWWKSLSVFQIVGQEKNSLGSLRKTKIRILSTHLPTQRSSERKRRHCCDFEARDERFILLRSLSSGGPLLWFGQDIFTEYSKYFDSGCCTAASGRAHNLWPRGCGFESRSVLGVLLFHSQSLIVSGMSYNRSLDEVQYYWLGLYHLVGGSTGPGYSLLRFDF